jgi:hypothetical protein
MHYTDVLPAGGSLVYDFSYEQASSGPGLASLERIERDRFATPTVTITRPRQNSSTTAGRVTVTGTVGDAVGVTSLMVNHRGVSLSPQGGFRTSVGLKVGRNAIPLTVTNVAGITHTVTLRLTRTLPRCQVPSLRGKSVAAARRALAKHSCATGRITLRASTTVAAGHVIFSSPRAGRQGKHGLKVALVVSRGP